uniref:TAFII28-like protein domain-containing protein n=1 Tax=Daucus carota subsp. sativus TaxID=79200 RepID=A0A166ESU2_DAUCS
MQVAAGTTATASRGKNKDDEEEELEEDNMDVELGKLQSTGDPDKMAKMHAILWTRCNGGYHNSHAANLTSFVNLQRIFRTHVINTETYAIGKEFRVCIGVLIVSSGNMDMCSTIPAIEPAIMNWSILSQFTEEQMSRYESFRRSGFQKANMKRLLGSITGSPKISVPMTIVVSGIAKIYVGELVETARVVMTERNETGPIRPCHIREAYRRLKLEGKVPKRSVPRLFR